MNTTSVLGRVWKFGNEMNTDLMVPGDVLLSSEEDQRRAVFRANRPGWVDLVGKGDVVIGGRNFGMGSARPAARSLRNVGIGALLADSLTGLFVRGAVNSGFIALECPGVSTAFEEGQTAEISLDAFTVCNRETGAKLAITRIPDMLIDLMLNGGLLPQLEQQGLIKIRPSGLAAPKV